MIIRIEVYEGAEITVSEFEVLQDDIQILDYYVELLEYRELFYAVFVNGVRTKYYLEGGEV
mgnify:CR=1 FL=1|tara:strand:+ start:13835 stop:14017 length:183 start_codon:yes stop_codon:yes gene_type:complete